MPPARQTILELATKPLPRVVVRLSNRWAIFDCDPDLHEDLKKLFRFKRPGYEFSPAFRDGSWDGWTNMMARGRVGTGLFQEARCNFAFEGKFDIAIIDERVAPKFKDADNSDLRPYQREAVERMVGASCTGGLILAATGVGKTRTAAGFFKRLVGNGLFIVDELALLSQSCAEIEKGLGEEVGVVGRSLFKPKRVTCATVQTLNLYRKKSQFRRWFKTVECVIIDELHVQLGRRNFDVIQSIKPKSVYGLTATLELEKPHVRLSAVALCGPPIFEYPIETGVEEGYLAEGRIVRLLFHDPLRGFAPGYWSWQNGKRLPIPTGSPSAQYRYHVCLNAARNGCVELLAREAVRRGRRTVVIIERKNHLRALSKRLNDVKHAALCGDDSAEARIAAMRAMDAGDLPLILASKIFSRGVDVRTVSCIIDATGMPSRNNAIQRYGRGVRKDGLKELLHIDVADSNGPFKGAAVSRLKALREIGSPITDVVWDGDAEKVFLV